MAIEIITPNAANLQLHAAQASTKEEKGKFWGLVGGIAIVVAIIIVGIILRPAPENEQGPQIIPPEVTEAPAEVVEEPVPEPIPYEEAQARAVDPVPQETEELQVGGVSWSSNPQVRINHVWRRVGDKIGTSTGEYEVARISREHAYLYDPDRNLIRFRTAQAHGRSQESSDMRRAWLAEQEGREQR